jgi:hypothetical protein
MLSTSTEKTILQKKRKTNVKKHTTRQTETQDNKPIKTQTGSRKPPEKINF